MTVDVISIRYTVCPNPILNNDLSIVELFWFLGFTISWDLKRSCLIDMVCKKAQQQMYILRLLRMFSLPQRQLVHFYTAIVQPVYCATSTVWFGSATRPQQMSKSAEKIIGPNLQTVSADPRTQTVQKLSDTEPCSPKPHHTTTVSSL